MSDTSIAVIYHDIYLTVLYVDRNHSDREK